MWLEDSRRVHAVLAQFAGEKLLLPARVPNHLAKSIRLDAPDNGPGNSLSPSDKRRDRITDEGSFYEFSNLGKH